MFFTKTHHKVDGGKLSCAPFTRKFLSGYAYCSVAHEGRKKHGCMYN